MSYLRDVARAVVAPLFRNDASQKMNGWASAANSRRFQKWVARREHLNTLIYGDGERLRERAHDVVRQNPWAGSAVESMKANVVSTGIKPQSRHPKKQIRELLHRNWDIFAANSDADGRLDFYGQQGLAFQTVVEGGEVLGRTRYRRTYDNYTIPMQYQLLEGEYLPYFADGIASPGNAIALGVEFDKLNQRVAYHLWSRHPYDYLPNPGPQTIVRVKADQIDHIFKVVRPGQIRGVTWLAPSLAKLYDINEYDDAELLRKKFSAMFVGFITENDPDDPVINTTTDFNEQLTSGPPDDGGADEQGAEFAELQAGTMIRLNAGEGVQFSNPQDVGGMYPEFMRQQLLAVAAGIGVTFEQMTGDVSDVNYSSIRSQVLEFRRKAEQWQFSILCHQMCQPVWERFVRALAIAGIIDSHDFATNPLDYLMVEWRTPLWAWVDPEKDIKAEIMEIRAGLKSRTQSVGERGRNVEALDAEYAAENKRADENDLVFDSDPRRRDTVGRSVVDTTSSNPNKAMTSPPGAIKASEPSVTGASKPER